MPSKSRRTRARKPFVAVTPPPAPPAPPKFPPPDPKMLELLDRATRAFTEAPNNPSVRVGFMVLLQGLTDVMDAKAMAKTRADRFRVVKVRKLGDAAASKLLSRCD